MKTLKLYLNFPRSKSPNRQIVQSPNRPIICRSPRLLVSLSLLLLSASLFAQNEANIWYFGAKCGLDFNTGEPAILYNSQNGPNSVSTMSDSTGALLFYTDEYHVFTKYHSPMLNDPHMPSAGYSGRVIVPWPGKENLYFVFSGTYTNDWSYEGFWYAIVDLAENNGEGAISDWINVDAGWDASDRIFALKQDNSDNIWIITRKFEEDAMAAFLVDQNGFHPEPVLSPMPHRDGYSGVDWGYIKVSFDKKFLISGYQSDGIFEVTRFDAFTGKAEYLYTHLVSDISLRSFEFSPDSRYFYYGYDWNPDTTTSRIDQLDMQYIADEDLFFNSAIQVASYEKESFYGMQLARDGKIYITGLNDQFIEDQFYMNVISRPWVRGVDCSFQSNILYMYPGHAGWALPNTLLDYLYRFEWDADNYCVGTTVKFQPNFIPEPDSIRWFFDEFAPGNYSNELSPSYTFIFPGIHEVEVDVWYPSGRYEHTSRKLEIFPNPEPDLGPDTSICEGNTLVLETNCPADLFSWSTGQFGVSSITISDSGTYWVRAKFTEGGCEAYDTIHVGFYPPISIDETNLIITPTTCSGASGSITGLYALGSAPFAYIWKDLSGNTVGTNIDVTGLSAGQYELTITDGNGCVTVSDVYTIEDAGNLQVLDVELTHPHCSRPDGQIVIHAFSPSGSALQYSINDGASYQADSVFSGLSGAGYVVRVTDENGCEGFYFSNPVVLVDIPGPQVTQVNITDETDFLGNGAIEIIASGATPVIYYSIDGGATYQSNNGAFNNVVCSMYYVIIMDENGCDTSFTVEVQNIILTYLDAITGPGGHCMGTTAMVPVEVDNFNSVATFHLKLSYNADNLQCEGFANVHLQLVDSLTGWVDLAAGEINLAWQSPSPVTLTGTETIAELVFTTINPGQGQLSWYTGTTDSYFTNASGSPIPAEFHTGEVEIYEPPEIFLSSSKTVCEGQDVVIMGIASGNQPPIDYLWIYPNGDTTTYDPFYFNVFPSDAGLYTLLVTDHVGCTDQKSIELIVSENPVAAFHGLDTLEMHSGDVLDAGSGKESLEWSTGDTTQSIVIQAEGLYSVGMESLFGCTGRDSIYVKLTSDEIPSNFIFIPNAFSPDGDGLNDIFAAKASSDYIQKFHMLIFDRWGGQIFESNDIMFGWDGTKHGTPLPGGMYTYKITYSIYPSLGDYSEQVRFGTVMLVR